MAARKQTAEGRTTVWRFVDYEARWGCDLSQMGGMGIEMPKFLRWPLNAWKGEEGEAIRCLNRLRADKDFMLEQGWLVELLSHATNQQKEYQGYLVSSRKDPLTASMVGSILRVDGRRAYAFLTRLESVDLLERVAWPPGSDGDIPDKTVPRLLQDVARASRKRDGKGGAKRPPRAEKAGPALNKGRNCRKAAAQQRVEGTGGEAARPGERSPAAARERPAAAAAGETVEMACPQCGLAAILRNVKSRLTCRKCGTRWNHEPLELSTPKTSTSSTSPDAGAGPAHADQADAGLQPGPPLDSRIVRLGDVLAGRERTDGAGGHRYSAEANAFGEQVLAASGYVMHDRGEYVNEVAHWAKLWQQAAGSLTELGLAKVKTKVLRVAARIRTQRHQYDCPEAYLERTMQNEIRDQKRAHRVQTG